MKTWTQWAVLGTAILAVGVAAACRLAYYAGPRPVAPRAPVAAQTFPDPTQMYSPPTSADRKVVARIEAKSKVAEDVIAGRLSLLQAAAAFRDLHEPGPPPVALGVFPEAASMDEFYCRSVIGYVNALAPPDRAEEVTSRLEGELAARLRDGTLRLPGP